MGGRSNIYLGTTSNLFGRLVFMTFDVTIAANFYRALFQENGKTLFKIKKNYISYLTFMFLAHITVSLLNFITP